MSAAAARLDRALALQQFSDSDQHARHKPAAAASVASNNSDSSSDSDSDRESDRAVAAPPTMRRRRPRPTSKGAHVSSHVLHARQPPVVLRGATVLPPSTAAAVEQPSPSPNSADSLPPLSTPAASLTARMTAGLRRIYTNILLMRSLHHEAAAAAETLSPCSGAGTRSMDAARGLCSDVAPAGRVPSATSSSASTHRPGNRRHHTTDRGDSNSDSHGHDDFPPQPLAPCQTLPLRIVYLRDTSSPTATRLTSPSDLALKYSAGRLEQDPPSAPAAGVRQGAAEAEIVAVAEVASLTLPSGRFNASSAPLIGHRYRVDSEIGTGTFGVVVSAFDTFLPQRPKVAIKVIDTQWERIGKHEAAVLRRLAHADPDRLALVCHLHHSFLIGGHVCLAMDLMSTTSVTDFVQTAYAQHGENARLAVVRKIAGETFSALAFIAKSGLIHADIKPSNILIAHGAAQQWSSRLCDFGNALRNNPAAIGPYTKDFSLQTLWYRAPEVLLHVNISPQIDVWSLGMTLAEIYHGTPLFPEAADADALLAELAALLGGLPTTLLAVSPIANPGTELHARLKQDPRLAALNPGGCSPGPSAHARSQLAAAGPLLVAARLRTILGCPNVELTTFLAATLCADPDVRIESAAATKHIFLARQNPAILSLLPTTIEHNETEGKEALHARAQREGSASPLPASGMHEDSSQQDIPSAPSTGPQTPDAVVATLEQDEEEEESDVSSSSEDDSPRSGSLAVVRPRHKPQPDDVAATWEPHGAAKRRRLRPPAPETEDEDDLIVDDLSA